MLSNGHAISALEFEFRSLDVRFGSADDNSIDCKDLRDHTATDLPYFLRVLVAAETDLPFLVFGVVHLIFFLVDVRPDSVFHDSEGVERLINRS